MRLQKVICDRCRKEEPYNESSFINRGWISIKDFPVPIGHISRLDSRDVKDVDLCNECHLELRKYWIYIEKRKNEVNQGT